MRLGIPLLLVSSLLGGCAGRWCQRVGADHLPTWEARPCPPGWEGDLTCGQVTVAAVPGEEGSCALELGVVRVAPSAAGADAVPAILLPGGPGQTVLDHLPVLRPVLAGWHAHRPLLLLDPRGAGWSRPTLACPPDRAGSVEEAFGGCGAHLRREGADLDAFRTERLADDVDAVLEALGYARAHVVGGSYGTRWAQTLVARHPDRVASLLLDAPAPWDERLLARGPTDFLVRLSALDAACAADPGCTEVVDGVEATFWATAAAWDGEPARVRTGDHVVPLDGRALAVLTSEALRHTALLPAVPALIAEAARGEPASLARLLALRAEAGVDPMLHRLVLCADSLPGTPPPQTDPRLPAWDGFTQAQAVCAALDVTPSADAVRTVPDLGVPTLVLTGAWDPTLPETWAARLAARSTDGRAWVHPAAGHGVLRTDCGRATAEAWLADPHAFRPPPCWEDEPGPAWVRDPGPLLDRLEAEARR
ncbi:MAG: alpha/beta fold hydrolase [Alphaproteobacteria bacterium]|nr:alpha/beta fold hydrolase [Alphaproteobacteria bacterium]